MIPVENASGLLEVVAVFDHVVPRKVEHELQVVALDSEIGHLRIHALKARKLLFKVLGRLGGPIFFRRSLPKNLKFSLKAVAPELLLNGAHLLLQKILALLVVKLRANLVDNVVFNLEQMLLLTDVLEHLLSPALEVVFFEKQLLFVYLKVGIARNKMQQKSVGLNILYRDLRLGWNVGALLNNF